MTTVAVYRATFEEVEKIDLPSACPNCREPLEDIIEFAYDATNYYGVDATKGAELHYENPCEITEPSYPVEYQCRCGYVLAGDREQAL